MRKEEWNMIPKSAPPVGRNCSGCGRKTGFMNSGNFRVNANGSRIDVWLIYRCEKCGTSWNMDIYARTPLTAIDKGQYESFLKNDREAALAFGCRKDILSRNKAEVLWEQMEYEVEMKTQEDAGPEKEESNRKRNCVAGRFITIRNRYGISLRLDKFLSRLLGCSRKDIAQMEKEGKLSVVLGGRDSRSKIPEYMEILLTEYMDESESGRSDG